MNERKFIYDPNGYFNADEVLKSLFTFIFVTGARATGKTFSTLKSLIENRKKGEAFIYLRRTQEEADLQAIESTSSLTKVLRYCKVNYSFRKITKSVGGIFIDDDLVFYTCALSTFSKIRGVNFDNVKVAVYDEFIAEPHVRSFKAEGMALNNFYESVNRNRELEGEVPLKLVCLSNSLNLANDVFIEWDLIRPAEELARIKEGEIYTRNNTLLIIMKNSPISEKKKETALYQNASEEFAKMAIENKFILNDFTYIKKRNLKQFSIILQIGDLYLYRHKSERLYYVTFVKGTTKNKYNTTQADLERFRRKEWRYYTRYLDGFVVFDSYEAIALWEKYYK